LRASKKSQINRQKAYFGGMLTLISRGKPCFSRAAANFLAWDSLVQQPAQTVCQAPELVLLTAIAAW
jgi:hypothetical protein